MTLIHQIGPTGLRWGRGSVGAVLSQPLLRNRVKPTLTIAAELFTSSPGSWTYMTLGAPKMFLHPTLWWLRGVRANLGPAREHAAEQMPETFSAHLLARA